METKKLRTRDASLYLVPVLIVDLLVQVIVFRLCAVGFHYWDPADLVMYKMKAIYFVIVGFLVSVVIVPPAIHERGVRVRDVLYLAFFQSLVTLGVCAVSVEFLFSSFAGRLYLPCGVIATFSVFLCNLVLRYLINSFKRRDSHRHKVIVVGSDSNALSLYKHLSEPDYSEYKVIGLFSDSQPGDEFIHLGSVFALDGYLETHSADSLYCSISPARNKEVVDSIIRCCDNHFVDFFYIPDMEGYPRRSLDISSFAGVNIISLRDEPLSNPLNSFLKRFFDLVISGLLLVTVFPIVWLFVAIGTALTSPGPIFFKQQRTGYKGQPFTLLKFRSMKPNKDADIIQATEDDPRKTAFGSFLRRSSIDELPQLINVFRGDMSLIGPRPHMIYHTELYNEIIDRYMLRHMVKPGLTGWAQVNGYRGETRTPDMMEKRVSYDIWYIENWSLFIDMKIILMTVKQLLMGDKNAF